MPDEQVQLPGAAAPAATENTVTGTENQIDLLKLAQFAFNEAPPAADPASPAAIVAGAGATPAGAAAPAAGAAPGAAEESILDENAFIKQISGVDTVEAFKSEWQQLQELKKNPPKAAEVVWANDQAKKIAAAINSGDMKTVRDHLDAQLSLAGVDTMNEEQKLKLFIKLQNPLYDQELIDYQYNKDFKFDDSAFKDDQGNVTDPLGLRFAKTQALQKAQHEVARANEFFGTYKTKLELPDIGAQQNTPNKDYDDFKASNAESKEFYEKSIVPALTALSEKDVPLSFKVEDAKNQMEFDVALSIEKSDFDAAKKDALDYPAYLSNTFYDKDGNFLAAKMQRAIALEKNFDKYAQSIARQAVNAERQRVINKETGGNGQRRDYNTVEMPSEFKALEDMVFPAGN